MSTEIQIEPYYFRLPTKEFFTQLWGEEAEDWKIKANFFKGLVQANIEQDPNHTKGFRGVIPVDDKSGDFTFFWRSWISFGERFRGSSGNVCDTGWSLPTFCLQRSRIMDEESLRNAEKYVNKYFEVIKCAIFESCEQQGR